MCAPCDTPLFSTGTSNHMRLATLLSVSYPYLHHEAPRFLGASRKFLRTLCLPAISLPSSRSSLVVQGASSTKHWLRRTLKEHHQSTYSMAEGSRKRRKTNESSGMTTSDNPPMEVDEKCFIGSIDQGTTSSRFLIFDKAGNPVASHQIEFQQLYPHSG